jgi:hypothetical protein
MELEDLSPIPVPDDPPPFLRKWSRVYVAVLGYLLLVIAALYGLTQLFSY